MLAVYRITFNNASWEGFLDSATLCSFLVILADFVLEEKKELFVAAVKYTTRRTNRFVDIK